MQHVEPVVVGHHHVGGRRTLRHAVLNASTRRARTGRASYVGTAFVRCHGIRQLGSADDTRCSDATAFQQHGHYIVAFLGYRVVQWCVTFGILWIRKTPQIRLKQYC